MTKEKLASLNKYLADLTNRLAAPPSAKHASNVKELGAWLQKEIAQTKAKLDAARDAK